MATTVEAIPIVGNITEHKHRRNSEKQEKFRV